MATHGGFQVQSEVKTFEFIFTRYVLGLAILAVIIAVGVFAYLGSFSRYLADDYCEAVRVRRSSPVDATIERYLAGAHRAANRYSNILFVGFSEALGQNNMPVTIMAMVMLWGLGLVWCVYETRMWLGINWPISFDFFWGLSVAFFSLLLAPNLFQTVYWRSSMMTHFAPLVCGVFLLAFFAAQSRRLQFGPIAWWAYPIVFAAAFIIAGFSEPPSVTMITGLLLMMVATWGSGRFSRNPRLLALFVGTFSGALIGLATMIFSPAGVRIAQAKDLNISDILGRSIYYSYLFLVDSLKTAPLPLLICGLFSLTTIWLQKQIKANTLPPIQRRTIKLVILLIPVLLILLVAAGFAPSVYGQNFPVERMRFLARTFLITALMLEGAMIGWLLGDRVGVVRWVALAFFAGTAFVYPLRAAVNVYTSLVPVYGAHAEQWDLRDAQIRSMVEQGATEVVVVQLDTMYGVNEYKGDETHWINVCAARYYGLNSIVAP
jgi:hypothetical protein